jgi:N-formylglutamate amidohydrolase
MDFQKYFEYEKGMVPIVLSCPHGGYKKPKNIPDKLFGPMIADKNTYFISKSLINELKSERIRIYYVLNKLHRSKIDLNRPPLSSHAFHRESNIALSIHNLYHDYLFNFSQECIAKYQKCLLIDLHGFTKPEKDYPDVIFGHVFGNTLSNIQDTSKNDCNKFWGCSQLYQEISKNFTIDDGLAITNFNLSYSGGYITHQFYNMKRVNAIQIEIAKYIRLNNDLTKKMISTIVRSIIETLN